MAAFFQDTFEITPLHPSVKNARWFIVAAVLWWITGISLLVLSNKEDIYRFINGRHTALLDTVLPWLTFMGTAPVIIATCLLLLIVVPRYRNRRFLVMALLCNIFPFLVCQLIKRWVNAPRPLRYFDKADWMHLVQGQPEQFAYSFPSGHTAGAFAFFCFLSLLLPAGKRALGLVFALLSLSVAYSRIYLSQHFYDDVYAGSIVGCLSCLFIFVLLRKKINMLSNLD